ncbi:MAG: NfeD family protein [Spirochaetales bacterium]|nr:NfeD family protein [Spirochaetales bacterium]
MPLFLLNNLPFVWLGLAIVLVIIEGMTMGLTTIWFAMGALISMLLAFFHMPIQWQVLLFLIISGVLLFFTRPVALKKLKIGKTKTNSESLIGEACVVIETIPANEKGQVKINGQPWRAAASGGILIAEGTRVVIDKIEGVTMYVTPEKN